jgi:hypothetical protein
MLAVIWKLFNNGIGLYEFMFVVLFAAIGTSLVYGIDFVYRRLKK